MPSGSGVKFEIKQPVSMATGPGEARVLVGTYVGFPSEHGDGIFGLFRVGADGEPIGERQGQIGAVTVDAASGGAD